jgi:hypothetical protein
MLALAQFAVRLICGMTLVLSVMPKAAVASGFFRVQMLIVMGLGVLAVLADGTGTIDGNNSNWMPQLHWYLSVCLALLGFVSSVLWTLERRKAAIILLVVTCEIAVLTLGLGILLSQPQQWQTHGALVFLSDFSSALTLGSAMCGMLLGHSYLTTPTMSISPLFRLNQFVGWAGVARGIISGIVLSMAWQSHDLARAALDCRSWWPDHGLADGPANPGIPEHSSGDGSPVRRSDPDAVRRIDGNAAVDDDGISVVRRSNPMPKAWTNLPSPSGRGVGGEGRPKSWQSRGKSDLSAEVGRINQSFGWIRDVKRLS